MKKLFAILATAGMLAISAMPAVAAPILRFTSGASSLTITDNGAGDLLGTSGAITFAGSVGDFGLTVTTGLTKPAIGSAETPEIDLNSVSVTSGGAGNLLIEFTETGFTGGAGAWTDFLSQIGGTINNDAGSQLFYTVYVDAANTAFGKTTQVFSGTFGPGAFSDALTALADLTSTGAYSITLVANLTHGGAGVSSFDGFTTVPEPASVALAGMGLMLIGIARRRRPQDALAS